MATRKELRDRIWQLVDTSIKGYGDLIDILIRRVPVEKLQEVVDILSGEED